MNYKVDVFRFEQNLEDVLNAVGSGACPRYIRGKTFEDALIYNEIDGQPPLKARR